MDAESLPAVLATDVSARVAAYIVEMEFPAYAGPIGAWAEHYGKGKGQVQSPTGESSCAEAEIVRHLRAAGWNAAWLEDWSPSTIPAGWKWAWLDERELPTAVQQRHERIREQVRERIGQRGGCWDVIAWKGEALWYLEAKGRGDGLGKNQVAWWVAASELDPTIDFAIVQWRHRR